MNNQTNGEENSKYESLSIKEQMMGKKLLNDLPDDFYEKVLECELSLKEKFDVQVLGTLIQYYSLAVEHFSSIGDEQKCQEYNGNLNLLFKQMEMQKLMKEGNNLELNAKKEEIKKELEKVENKVDSTTVKKIMNKKENKQIKSGKSIILKEIFNQALSFKQKLENKKKKYKLKLNLENSNTSAISKNQKQSKDDNLPLLKLFNSNNPINKPRISKSVKSRKNKTMFEESDLDKTFHNSFKSDKNNIFNNISKIKSKNFINLNDISNEKIKNDIVEIKDNSEDFVSSIDLNFCDESTDVKLNLSSLSSKSLNFVNKKNDFAKITKKKGFQNKVKTIISDYMKGYYMYFMENTINKIIKDYEKQSYNISKELMEEENNYYHQERQMEYLRDEEDDESYNEQIEGALKNIRDEKEQKISDIYEKYYKSIRIINDKYLLNTNNNFHWNEIEILKEKMKLEITKEINNSVLK